MSDLSECEIFDCMLSNLKLAAEHCEDLAKLPRKGPSYTKLRDELRLIEGACRQASAWREDTRWLAIANAMGEAHQKAGGWLRGMKVRGVRVAIAPGHMHPLFMMLAANLRRTREIALDYRDRATGRVGTILPDVLPGPHRETRPVQVLLPSHLRSKGGIILPTGATVQ